MVATLTILGWSVASACVAGWMGVFREREGAWRAVRGPGSLRRLGFLSLVGLSGWMVLVGLASAAARGIAPGSVAVAVTLSAAATAFIGGLLLWMLPMVSDTPRRAGWLTGIGTGFVGLLLVLPWVYLALTGTLAVLRWWQVDVEPTHETIKTLANARSPGLIVLLMVSTAVITPVFEEALFRGAIQGLCVAALTGPPHGEGGGTGKSGGRGRGTWARWGGIAVASLVFAGMHAPWSMPAIFVLGLGLGYVYERTGRLWPAIVMHALFNAIALTQTLLTKGTPGVGG